MPKKKCPNCGAKNSKERMTCMECGTPLSAEQVNTQLSRVSAETEAQLKTVTEKALKEGIKDEYRDNEKALYKTNQLTAHKKSAWFWIGVALLSISALWWLILFLVPGDIGGTILAGVVTTIVPIGIGVYCVRRGRKARTWNMQRIPKPSYMSQPTITPTQEIQRATAPTYPARPVAKPTQTRHLGFFGTIKERLRDKTRDRLCAGLCAMGIDARLAERGRVEENFGGKGSLGLIEIPEGPILWVNVRKETHGGGQGGSVTYYYTEYGVPDPVLEPNTPLCRIKTVRVKTFPLVGRVVDLRWKGDDSDLGIISRLNSDTSIKHPIMENRDVTIHAHGYIGCWIISTKTRDVPSGELWNCYQAIARHLLAERPK